MPSGINVTHSKWVERSVIFDNGVFSVIWGLYRHTFDDNSPKRLGIRWNGDNGKVGFPNVRADDGFYVPVWFVVPEELSRAILHELLEITSSKNDRIAIANALEELDKQSTWSTKKRDHGNDGREKPTMRLKKLAETALRFWKRNNNDTQLNEDRLQDEINNLKTEINRLKNRETTMENENKELQSVVNKLKERENALDKTNNQLRNIIENRDEEKRRLEKKLR